MTTKKKIFKIYSSKKSIGNRSVQANVLDLLKKNKKEEKQNKIRTIYTVFLFVSIIVFLGTYIYL